MRAIIGGVIICCAAPAAALNIWPRAESILQKGAISSNEIGVLILVTMSVLAMSAVPFAMKKADNWGFWCTCLAFGLGLGTLNYLMAVGAIGKVRDNEANNAKAIIHRAEDLKARIAKASEERSKLPSFRWTSEGMVKSAETAVQLTDDARKRECEKVGDYCRALVAQLQNRQAELAVVARDRSITQQREALDNSIRSYEAQMAQLGTIPASIDPQAARIGNLIRKFIHLGDDYIESVADGIIQFLAISAELFALLGPRVLITAISSSGEARTNHNTNILPRRFSWWRESRIFRFQGTSHTVTKSPLPAPTPARADPVSTKRSNEDNGKHAANHPARPIVESRPSKTIQASGEPKEWLKFQTQPKPGNRLHTWTAYTSYTSWCQLRKLQPLTAPAFRFQMVEVLKVKEEQVLRKTYYCDIELATQLRVVS